MEEKNNIITTSLIYKKLNGGLTGVEEKMFQKWLEESPAHMRYFNQMRYYIEQLPESTVSEKEIDEAWKTLADKIVIKKRISRRNWGVYGMSIAATIALLIGAWILWKGVSVKSEREEEQAIVQNNITPGQYTAILELANGEIHQLGVVGLKEKQIGTHIMADSCELRYVRPDSQDLQVAYNKLSVPRGGEYQLRLEDGTKVWLNSDSRLKYPEVFIGQQREVFLEGEAYFEVAKDIDKPFVVHAGNQSVRVLGTDFGVTYYTDEAVQTVTLVKGKVEVGFTKAVQDKFILYPGNQVIYNRNNHQVACKEVDVQEFVAWKDGKYVFTQKRLEDMLNTLSRWYDFQVFYQNASCKDILFSGEIKRFENFKSILELIQKTSDVKFNIRGNRVQVMKN